VPISISESLPVMLAANQTREIYAGGSFVIRGIYEGVSLSVRPAPDSGDVTLLSISVDDGGGTPRLRYEVRNNRPTASEFVRTSVVIRPPL
jgi:hypothetical protein